MAEPTVFHLVRHAAHGLLPHSLAGRMPGVALSEEGRAQAAGLAGRLGAVDHVVTSPVQRARETAEAIAAGLPVEVEAAFEEIDFGAWTGMRFDALAPDPAWQRWNALRGFARCPGGESMAEAQARALAGLERLRAARPGQVVAVVSHADVIKAVLAAALGVPLDRLHRFVVDPASISTLTAFDNDVRVDGLNR